MLTSLQLENYRRFTKYSLDGLKQVNLLVGKNGCGKTSILEALYLLASPLRRKTLTVIAFRRGEVVSIRSRPPEPSEIPGLGEQFHPRVRHLFNGHQVAEGSSFRLSCQSEPEGGFGSLEVKAASLSESSLQAASRRPFGGVTPVLELHVESSNRRPQVPMPKALLSEDGVILEEVGIEGLGDLKGTAKPVQFVTRRWLEPGSVRVMWDMAVLSGREDEAVRPMAIVEPRLRDIQFLSVGLEIDGAPADIVVGLNGAAERVPMGSLGDGFRYLLALSLSLVNSQGGLLLVDEIDSGLHYSVMGDMWRLVIEAAKRSNIQVFATTHSLDCVRGLAWLCANYPDLGAEVSLQKIVPSLEHAVAFDAHGIMIAAEQEIELR